MPRKTKDLKKETKLIKENEENTQSLPIPAKTKKLTKRESKILSKKTETKAKKESKKIEKKVLPVKEKKVKDVETEIAKGNKSKKAVSKSSDKTTKNKKTTEKAKRVKGKSSSSRAKKGTKSVASQNLNNLINKRRYSKTIIKNTPKSINQKYTSTMKIMRKKFKTEYYDLPFSYNKTVVKILAQTPTTLFVYWELSEKDANNFRKKYGDNFFDITKPILVLYNDTMNYVYEIEINDFANSWYIHVNDSNCDYHVELGRKPISAPHNISNNLSHNTDNTTNISNNFEYIPYYVFITSSNKMILPNDKILFNSMANSKILFRNIKTGSIKERNITEFKFITNYGIFTIQELYKYLYPNENFEYEEFFKNPSSGLRSSMSSR